MSSRFNNWAQHLGLTLAVIAATSLIIAYDPIQLEVASVIAFVGAFALVEVVPLSLPRGGRFRLNGGVAIAAILLLGPIVAALAEACGGLSGALIAGRKGTSFRDVMDVLRSSVVILLVGLVWTSVGQPHVINPRSAYSLIAALALGVGYMLADILTWVVVQEQSPGHPFVRNLGNMVNLLGGVYLGQLSVGVVIAVVQGQLGVVAVASLTILMLIMQHTFGSLLKVRSAYTKTVSALARVAEISQGVPTGHGERVATTSAAIGRYLGLGSEEIEKLTLAALLHDVGGVRDDLAEPGQPRRLVEHRHAAIGATLISRVDFLSSLSPVIARHSAAYSDYIDLDEDNGLLARIIHVASDLDNKLLESGCDSIEEALAGMKGASGQEYDPRVVEGLAQTYAAGEIAGDFET